MGWFFKNSWRNLSQLVQLVVAGILDLVHYTRMHNQTLATTKKTNYPLKF